MLSSPSMNPVYALRTEQDRAFAKLGGRAPTLDQQREMADEAARLKNVYADLELAMPEPGPTDTPQDYRVRLLKPLQKFSGFRNSDLAALAARGALRGIDQQIIADATAKAAQPGLGSFRHPGQLREIRRREKGHDIVEFRGNPLTWMAPFMGPAETRVEGFDGPDLLPRRHR